jgi:hypothetical protein
MMPIFSYLPIALASLLVLGAEPKAALGQAASSSPLQARALQSSDERPTQGQMGGSPATGGAGSAAGPDMEGPPGSVEGGPGSRLVDAAFSESAAAAMAPGGMMEPGGAMSGVGGNMGGGAGMGLVPDRATGRPNLRPFSRIALAAKMGTMGAGFEVAVPLSRRTNLRSTGNFFSYSHTFNQDGVDYTGTISLRSMQTTLDWFPFHGGFHISPGFFAYGGNNVKAHAAVPGGQTFTLNSTDYRSSLIDPIHGSGKITVNNAGPGLTVGWGNLLPRNRRHFSFPFEIGAVYEGAPKIALQLGGSACDSSGINCNTVASDPSFQQNLTDEQTKLNRDVEPYKFYPIISFGFAVNF